MPTAGMIVKLAIVEKNRRGLCFQDNFITEVSMPKPLIVESLLFPILTRYPMGTSVMLWWAAVWEAISTSVMKPLELSSSSLATWVFSRYMPEQTSDIFAPNKRLNVCVMILFPNWWMALMFCLSRTPITWA